MYEVIGTATAVLVPAIGAIVWLVRLEGRLNVSDAKHTAMEKRVDSLEQRILDQLDRIEDKIDRKADR
jgi:hypothetical protein